MKKIVHPLIFIFVVFFAVLQGIFLIRGNLFWDEAVYVGIGKYLWSLGQSGIYESFRPIVLPLILGFFWKIGLSPVFVGKAFMIVMSSWSLYLVYLIARKHMNHWFSLFSVIAVALTPVYFVFASKLMTSMLALFFLLAALYRLEEKKSIQAGVFLGLAFLTRFPAGLFLIPAFFMAKEQKWTVLKTFVITTIPYFVLNLVMGNGLIRPLLEAGAHQANSVFGGAWWFYFGVFIAVPLVLFCIPGLFTTIKEKHYGILALALIPLAYFSSITIKQERFAILFFPFFILIAMHALYRAFKKLRKIDLITQILFVFLVASCVISAMHIQLDDTGYYPAYSQFFTDENSTVITTTPIPAAFSDAKFIPAYFDINQAFYTYLLHKNDAEYVLYSSEPFYCDHFGDDCKATQAYFEEALEEHKEILTKDVDGYNYTIYKLEN